MLQLLKQLQVERGARPRRHLPRPGHRPPDRRPRPRARPRARRRGGRGPHHPRGCPPPRHAGAAGRRRGPPPRTRSTRGRRGSTDRARDDGRAATLRRLNPGAGRRARRPATAGKGTSGPGTAAERNRRQGANGAGERGPTVWGSDRRPMAVDVSQRRGPAAADGAPRWRTPRPGRAWVVPWVRRPATRVHHSSARRRASATSTNSSPAKNEACT